jgi:transposase-like protein
VCRDTKQATIELSCETKLNTASIFYTDESNAYNKQGAKQAEHHTVCHSKKEFARDRDGDGIFETHCNTIEGIWTGVRNFLRPFRGIHKRFLAQYVAVFEWTFNLKKLTTKLFRAFLIPNFTF